MRSFRRKVIDLSGDETSINLTPLIDVVFVVLIIFILIAPMLELDTVQLADAPSGHTKSISADTEKGALTIHVHADNTIWINSKKVGEKDLVSFFAQCHRKNPKQNPQLYQDKKAFFGTYQTVKNALEKAGYEELDIILKPNG